MSNKITKIVIHIDDEKDDLRRIPESILHDSFQNYFEAEKLESGSYEAKDGGYGDVTIKWTYDENEYVLTYYKCLSEDRIHEIEIEDDATVIFIFDVHRDSEDRDGVGNFLNKSRDLAQKTMNDRPFLSIIWTQIQIDKIEIPDNCEAVQKGDTVKFGEMILERLGFSKVA